MPLEIKHLDVGLERVSRWQRRDEVHLPKEGGAAPAFLPEYRPLDEILTRPSLDERLPLLLQPEFLDPDLMEPSVLSQVRLEVSALFASEAARLTAQKDDKKRNHLEKASRLLSDDTTLDEEIRSALFALLRG